MQKAVSRAEFEAMKKQVAQLEKLTLQQGEMLRNFEIIIHGDVRLGVEGFSARQRKDDSFREDTKNSFRILGEKVEKIDTKVDPLVIDVKDLIQWRKALTGVLTFVSNDKFWKIVLSIVLFLITAGAIIKLKVLNLILGK